MVYVDNMEARFGRMIMCHMIADTTEELLEMADKIGVNRKWIQDAGTYSEHFDICLSKKKKAIALGAKEITMKELSKITLSRPDSPFKGIVEQMAEHQREYDSAVRRIESLIDKDNNHGKENTD